MNREQMLNRKLSLFGIFSISLAFAGSLIISAFTLQEWPASFSALLKDPSSPQSKLFFTLGLTSGVCFLQSWILYREPKGVLELFRHFSFCLGIIILATIPAPGDNFLDFGTNEKIIFVMHTIGAILGLMVHPMFELLGIFEFESVNSYDTNTQLGKFRFWFAIISIVLIILFVVLLWLYAAGRNTGIASFVAENLLLVMLLVNAWVVTLTHDE